MLTAVDGLAVLVPFKKNIFAVAVTRPSTSFSTSFTKFLDSLVPAQVKAISHLVVQPNTISTCTWNQLKRLEGLAILQYVILVHPFLYPQRWIDEENRRVTDAKLDRLAELPHLRSVSIQLRMAVYESITSEEDVKQIPESLTTWAESVERKMLPRRESS